MSQSWHLLNLCAILIVERRYATSVIDLSSILGDNAEIFGLARVLLTCALLTTGILTLALLLGLGFAATTAICFGVLFTYETFLFYRRLFWIKWRYIIYCLMLLNPPWYTHGKVLLLSFVFFLLGVEEELETRLLTPPTFRRVCASRFPLQKQQNIF